MLHVELCRITATRFRVPGDQTQRCTENWRKEANCDCDWLCFFPFAQPVAFSFFEFQNFQVRTRPTSFFGTVLILNIFVAMPKMMRFQCKKEGLETPDANSE